MAKRTVIGRAHVSEKILSWQNMWTKFKSFYSSRKVRSSIPWSTRKPVISKALFQDPVQHLPLAMTSPSSLSFVVLLSSNFGIFSLFWSITCDRGNIMIFFYKILLNWKDVQIIWDLFSSFWIQKYKKMTAVSESDLATKCLEFSRALNGQCFQVLPHFDLRLFFLLWLKGSGHGQEEAKPFYN